MLRPEDDLIHPIGQEPWWREAWYWGFYDRHTGVHVTCYLGVFPNPGTSPSASIAAPKSSISS